jgi:hypothetical protein
MLSLILNDVHIGATRMAGTTVESRLALRRYLLESLRDTVTLHTDKDCIINGDLFDSFEVDVNDLLFVFHTFVDWLRDSGKTLHLVRGNHDIAKNSMKVSSFALLCSLLTKMFPEQVCVYDNGLEQIHEYVWVIPHVVNQDIFNMELEKALEIEPVYLLLHANVDNKFAEQSDHSLNVSEEMIKKLVKHGHTLVFAHEHHRKELYKGMVLVLGNQWPSSVYDCLANGTGQKDGCKYAHILHEEPNKKGGVDVCLGRFMTWDGGEDFVEMDWRELHGETDARFIRVIGECTASQAAEMVTAISKYRQRSPALVITNAVMVEGIEGMGDLARLSQERLEAVDVMAALCEQLDPPEVKAVKSLWEGRKS